MKLVGVLHPRTDQRCVAVLEAGAGGEPTARILADADTFWGDPSRWLADGVNAEGPLLGLDTLVVVPPVRDAARVLCVGLNYHNHVTEGSFRHETLPAHPTIFGRWTASLAVDGQAVPVPATEDGLDWEGEIAAYVGNTLIDAEADVARRSIVAYSTFNDLTARRAQKLTSQWTLGKNADRTGVLGPMVTADQVGDLRNGLWVQTRVNGEIVQHGNTRDMIFEIGEVMSMLSRTMTLQPGDVICTGTPHGVGYARNPPWLLKAGDVVEVEAQHLGVVSNPIVDNTHRHDVHVLAPRGTGIS